MSCKDGGVPMEDNGKILVWVKGGGEGGVGDRQWSDKK